MAKAKQGDYFSCAECGLIVVVDEVCGCDMAEIICCEAPMEKGKLAANKARKKALAQAAIKTVAKKTVKAQPKAAAKAVKKAAPKPAAKKQAAPKASGRAKKS